MQIIKNIEFITGSSEEFNLNHRILNALLFGGAILLLLVIITDYILQLYWLTSVLNLVALILFVSLFFYSRITKKSKLAEIVAFTFLVVVFTPIMWIVNGGSRGSFQYFIPFFIIGIHVATSQKIRKILIPLLIVIIKGAIYKLLYSRDDTLCSFSSNFFLSPVSEVRRGKIYQ